MEIIAEVLVCNKLGLHARSSAKLVKLAESFSSEILIGHNLEELVDAKSIIALLMLAANYGTTLKLKIIGDDANQALSAISKLFADKFDEGI